MEMEIKEKFIKDVLEAVDESKRVDALFELKHEYLRIKTKKETIKA